MADADVFLVKQHLPKAKKGISLLRHLLLGPLASNRRFVTRFVWVTDESERRGATLDDVLPSWNSGSFAFCEILL